MHNPTLKNPTEHRLHISYSQAWLYLNCSLKYYFRYVRGQPQEKISIAPMFGKAVHKAVERYYKDIMLGKAPAGLDILQELFTEHLQADLASTSVPVVFKKDLPDEEQAIAMGLNMLEAAYPDLQPGPGAVVAGVEVPLAAPLVDLEGNPLDIDLKGVVDLLLLEGEVNPTVVDFKTAKQSKSQDAADRPTVYFLDDLGQAPAAVQAAAMQLILERRINGHRVSDQVTFLAASNRKIDRAGVSGILEPVKSRFSAIVELEPDVDDWVKWAISHNLPPELIEIYKIPSQPAA